MLSLVNKPTWNLSRRNWLAVSHRRGEAKQKVGACHYSSTDEALEIKKTTLITRHWNYDKT